MSFELCTAISLGSSNSGLLLNATLFDKNHNLQTSGISYNFNEYGRGCYGWTNSAFPDSFKGYAIIHNSGSFPGNNNVLAMISFNPAENENSDVKTSSIGNTTVGTYQITCITEDNIGILGGSTVEIYPSGSSSLLMKTTTNMSNGQSLFNLDAGAYKVFIYNPTVSYWSNPSYFTVSSNSSVTFTGVRLAPIAPTGGGTARLYAYMYDLGLDELEGVDLIVTPSGVPSTINSSVITKHNIVGHSDSTGYVYTDIVAGLPVHIKIPKAKVDTFIITPSGGGLLNIAAIL